MYKTWNKGSLSRRRCVSIHTLHAQGSLHNSTLHGIQNSCQVTEVVRLSSASSYVYVVQHGDCRSEYGQIRENVGLLRCWITEVPLYAFMYVQ